MAVFETFMYDVGVIVDVFVFMAGVADDGFGKSSRVGFDFCRRVRLREEIQKLNGMNVDERSLGTWLKGRSLGPEAQGYLYVHCRGKCPRQYRIFEMR